jgi:hypothetical protein
VFVDCQLGLEEGKMKRSTKPERMDEPFSFKLDDRSHQSCVLHELGGNARVMSKLLRSGLLKKCAQADGTSYAAVFGAFQQRWLQERRGDYRAVRWRTSDQGDALWSDPVASGGWCGSGVLRQGGYLTLSKALLWPKATRLLSPWVEKQALEAATSSNYRPAAAELWRWGKVKVSAWLIWRTVQFHGAALCEQLDRQWWPLIERSRAKRMWCSPRDRFHIPQGATARARRKGPPSGHISRFIWGYTTVAESGAIKSAVPLRCG